MEDKKKISFLPFNLFWCLSTGSSCFVLLWFVGLGFEPSLVISLFFYMLEVNRNTTEDYLLYKIKQLEEKK